MLRTYLFLVLALSSISLTASEAQVLDETLVCTLCDSSFEDYATITLECGHTHHSVCLDEAFEDLLPDDETHGCPTCTHTLSLIDRNRFGLTVDKKELAMLTLTPDKLKLCKVIYKNQELFMFIWIILASCISYTVISAHFTHCT